MKNILYIFVALFFIYECSTADTSRPDPVILISFDGFGADYLQKTKTPKFDSLIAAGVTAEGLIPVFPTKTFPNHYSIATGLYPENTGVVGNTMYDPVFDAEYRIGDRDAVEDPRWYRGEPIWNTLEKQGVKTGTMFWVGSEAPIQDMRPTYWKPYEHNMPDSARIDTVVKWLSAPGGEVVDFATLYFSFVDSRGHRHGPNSPEVISAIQRADGLMGYLIGELRERNLFQNTNIIIVSDHGMAELSDKRVILLDEIINPEDVRRLGGSPVMTMIPDSGKTEEVYRALKEQEEHYRIYRKDELPERFHLKNHRRVPELIMIADLGYTITTKEQLQQWGGVRGGTHGFDNKNTEMDALFVAHGPAFKKDFTIGRIQSIHIYELINHLFGTKPVPNDGSLDSIQVILD